MTHHGHYTTFLNIDWYGIQEAAISISVCLVAVIFLLFAVGLAYCFYSEFMSGQPSKRKGK